MRRSGLRAAILILLALYAATSLAAGVFLAEIALRPPRETASSAKARAIADQHHLRLEEVAIDTADGVTLQAWLFAAPAPPPATVIVTHGVNGSRGHALALASLLIKHGYAVLAPDARGHGTSGGLASYGVRERRDLASWVDVIAARYPGRCVVGVGASMGAAQLLQAAGADRRICGVVAEASFATFKDVAFDRLAQHTGIGPVTSRLLARPSVEVGLFYVRMRYGLDLRDATPVDSLRAMRVPVLLIHGAADTNIPLRHAQRLAAANPAAHFWIVAGAGHTAAWRAAPAEYEARVLSLVREAVDSR